MQLWDLRNFKKPVHTVDGLLSIFPTTQCSFSPNEKLILTGVGSHLCILSCKCQLIC